MEKVKFTIAGSMVNEYIIKQVESRNLSKLNIPIWCYQIEFYSVINGRLQNKEVYKLGKVLTLNDVDVIYGTNSAAHRNMARMLKSNETPFLGAGGNLTIVKKTDNVLDPTTLHYPDNALSAYNGKLAKLTPERSF